MLTLNRIGRGFCAAFLLGMLAPAAAHAVSCPDLTAKRIAQFRKTTTNGAGRCLVRGAKHGVSCPDERLAKAVARTRARVARGLERRCPSGGADAALGVVQDAVYCEVLGVCPGLALGEVKQRIVANSTLHEPPAIRDLTVDVGWQGPGHNLRILEGAEFTADLSNCDGSTDTLCDLSGATNGLPFGPPSPLLAGGVGACVMLDFAADITGTIDVATGDVSEQTTLHGRFYGGGADVNPCPICVPTDEDPELGESGLCSAGPNEGMPCTVQGLTRPVLAGVSHDCPPNPLSFIGEFTIPVSMTTGSISVATTVDSPRCTGTGWNSQKCHCDTCDDLAATPCSSNADCPLSGGICGGRRCIGGPNAGAPCSTASQCPAPSVCARPGQPTQLNGCSDQVCTATADGGYCAEGPMLRACDIESYRECFTDDDCPAAGDSCVVRPQSCLPDVVTATGAPDVPSGNVAHPTLVGSFCMGPTYSVANNYTAGLPGLVRFQWPTELSFSE
jgi:hypothetical protein